MRILLSLSFIFLFLACSDSAYFSKSYTFEGGQWLSEEQATFTFTVSDSSTYYDLILEVDHSPDYTYENVYVKINTSFPSGEEVSDQVSLQLADDLDQWQGECNKTCCTVPILLQNRVRFKESGEYSIAIEQYNRVDPLEGINKLTFRVQELK